MIDYKRLLYLYKICLGIEYTHVNNDGDFAIRKYTDEGRLEIYFQCTNSKLDWFSNIDCVKRPYKDMKTPWKCHRGFLRVWKTIEPYIKDEILNPIYKKIEIIGYSHGAAIAGICHEYVWFNRPDIRDNIFGYGVGCPRFYGSLFVKKSLKERWANFAVIRNKNDIVTHVPPKIFFYSHVSKPNKIGKNTELTVDSKSPDSFKAHYPSEYIKSIEMEVENGNNI